MGGSLSILPGHKRAIEVSTEKLNFMIWKFIVNNNDLFPKRDVESFYDFGQDGEQEWLVEDITSHPWLNSKELELEVRWTLGDTTVRIGLEQVSSIC